jgi:hypothetical protein
MERLSRLSSFEREAPVSAGTLLDADGINSCTSPPALSIQAYNPDWRWRRVLSLSKAKKGKVGREEDKLTERALKAVRAGRWRQADIDPEEPDSDVSVAVRLYLDPQLDMAVLLEALALAGLSSGQIAQELALSEKVVSAYLGLYFDIEGKAHSRGYIHEVLEGTLELSAAEGLRTPDDLFTRWIGWELGADVLWAWVGRQPFSPDTRKRIDELSQRCIDQARLMGAWGAVGGDGASLVRCAGIEKSRQTREAEADAEEAREELEREKLHTRRVEAQLRAAKKQWRRDVADAWNPDAEAVSTLVDLISHWLRQPGNEGRELATGELYEDISQWAAKLEHPLSARNAISFGKFLSSHLVELKDHYDIEVRDGAGRKRFYTIRNLPEPEDGVEW